MARLSVARPSAVRFSRNLLLLISSGGAVVAAGIVCLIIAPFVGRAAFDSLWGVEPLGYIGSVLLIAGLAVSAVSFALAALRRAAEADSQRNGGGNSEEEQSNHWRETTLSFFNEFDHDLGRPLRRITGRQRELRAALRASGQTADPDTMDLLDEIERQAVNYRLMLSNIQVLVQSEAPGEPLAMTPVEPAEVVRRIVERYIPVAIEVNKHISWWADPTEFGMVVSNSHAMEHVVANLIDNAVTHASARIEVNLSRDDRRFYVRVWDDGPGISAHYLEYIFDRGWTPEVGRREEKSSSGLGLFIARSLAQQCGGELTVESMVEPDENHHTTFVLSIPVKGR